MIGDFEGTAELLYRAAGYPPSEPAPPGTLIERLLGPNAIRLVPERALPADAALVRINQSWHICVSEALPPTERRFAALHELAHWAIGLKAPEEQCDALAAALLVPRRAFLRAVDSMGGRITRLASVFRTTESYAALRLGETSLRPIVLVDPALIRTRGPKYSWPSEHQLREFALGQAFPGLRKAKLRDAPNRVAIRPLSASA